MRQQTGILVAAVAAFALAGGVAHATDPIGTGAASGSRVEVETQVGTQPGSDVQAPAPGHGTGTQVETQVNTGAAAPSAGSATGGTATDVQVKTLTTAPITGTLTVKDPTLRTFVVSGEETVYVAPEDVQLHQYEGEDVTVTFDPNGRVTAIEVDREG